MALAYSAKIGAFKKGCVINDHQRLLNCFLNCAMSKKYKTKHQSQNLKHSKTFQMNPNNLMQIFITVSVSLREGDSYSSANARRSAAAAGTTSRGSLLRWPNPSHRGSVLVAPIGIRCEHKNSFHNIIFTYIDLSHSVIVLNGAAGTALPRRGLF